MKLDEWKQNELNRLLMEKFNFKGKEEKSSEEKSSEEESSEEEHDCKKVHPGQSHKKWEKRRK